jgi:hypothetical protein
MLTINYCYNGMPFLERSGIWEERTEARRRGTTLEELKPLPYRDNKPLSKEALAFKPSGSGQQFSV